MYYLRDLYPNFAGARTQERTMLENEDVSALHEITNKRNGQSIWLVLVLLVVGVALLGVFGRE